MNKKLVIPIIILGFLLGGMFTYAFCPRLNELQDYNKHIREQIAICKADLIKKGFWVTEDSIPEYYYFEFKDFSTFEEFPNYGTHIYLEIDDSGIFLHARFGYRDTSSFKNFFVVYEVM